jgi:hypothetical protein
MKAIYGADYGLTHHENGAASKDDGKPDHQEMSYQIEDGSGPF